MSNNKCNNFIVTKENQEMDVKLNFIQETSE